MHPAKAVWVAVVAGCYSYSPPPMLTPVPGTHVALVLSDVGRVAMAPSIGAGVGRVEGVLLPSTDSAYWLQVSDVYGINGSHNSWTAETVAVRRAYVANTLERRFSRPRTYLTVVGASAAFVSFVLTRTLFGIGGAGSDNGSGGGGQNQ